MLLFWKEKEIWKRSGESTSFEHHVAVPIPRTAAQPLPTTATNDNTSKSRLNHRRLQLFLSGSSKFHRPMTEESHLEKHRDDRPSHLRKRIRWNRVKQSRVKWKIIKPSRTKEQLFYPPKKVHITHTTQVVLFHFCKKHQQALASDLRPCDITRVTAGVYERPYFIPGDTHRNQATVGN